MKDRLSAAEAAASTAREESEEAREELGRAMASKSEAEEALEVAVAAREQAEGALGAAVDEKNRLMKEAEGVEDRIEEQSARHRLHMKKTEQLVKDLKPQLRQEMDRGKKL